MSPQDLVYDRRRRRLGLRRLQEETSKKKAKLVSLDAAAAALMLYIGSVEVDQVLPINVRVAADVVDADDDDDCNSSTCQLDIDILIITCELISMQRLKSCDEESIHQNNIKSNTSMILLALHCTEMRLLLTVQNLFSFTLCTHFTTTYSRPILLLS